MGDPFFAFSTSRSLGQIRQRIKKGISHCAGGVQYSWQFVGGRRSRISGALSAEPSAHTAESVALSKDLKQRGFKFVGSTIIYAHMRTTGMVNDHLVGCPRHAELGWSSSRAPKASKHA